MPAPYPALPHPAGAVAPPTIAGCILARNEERRLEDALRSLQGWTDQILVIDNESEDGTAALARRYTDLVLSAPRVLNFDAARNLAIDHASTGWIFYLDADERVPPRLGEQLKRLVREHGHEFEALALPFKHYFCGKWMQHSGWWPGYKGPQLMKRGCFRYNERLHSGVEVAGRTLVFPADNPELAIVHHSYEDLHHYLEKLNRYTDGEAENLLADGQSHSWQAMLADFVRDWQIYYERGRADQDGMHGFVLSFMSAFYRFAARAKLWDQRRQRGEWNLHEPVPRDLEEMLEFMLRVSREGDPRSRDAAPTPAPKPAAQETLPLIWRGPLFGSSGYSDEVRQFVLGLLDAGEPVALAPEQWGDADAGLAPEILSRLQQRIVDVNTPAEICVSHTLPAFQGPLGAARFYVARTMFETDRLSSEYVRRLNAMDRIWVPSEFNRETFIRSGVSPEKLAVVPGTLDPAPFAAEVEPWPVPGKGEFRFLSVFDWTRHKGWDVLIEAFAAEFGDRPEIELLIKTWSSHGYTLEDLRAQADAHLRARTGKGLSDYPNIRLWQENLPTGELPRLYRAADAFVLPTRGEGWGRPLMEAMAAGLPTIATAWSGLTEFHNADVGYPLNCQVVPVPDAGAREIPIYAGHCWAEPDVEHLRQLLCYLVLRPEIARQKGKTAREWITRQFSRSAVAKRLQEELAHCRILAARKASGAAEMDADSGVDRTDYRINDPVSSPDIPAEPLSAPLQIPAANLLPRDPAEPVDFRKLLGRPLRVRWEGDQSILSSMALVNRSFCHGLLAAGDIELSLHEIPAAWHTLTPQQEPALRDLLPLRHRELSGPPDITIRHHFPPRWDRPENGNLVVIQPWECSHLPGAWVDGATLLADEVWAYSRFVRDVYVRSGVPAEKIRIVPLGFDPAVFHPEGLEYPLPTKKRTRFLFVGGAVQRKGPDLLLEAYRRAFRRSDDVCLIVKDMATRTFYAGDTLAAAFHQAQNDPHGPEVLYLDDDLSPDTLAALYRAGTCLVLPYRGEGFALPPLEAMACGRPAIVTAGGATDDYLDGNMALRVPFRRRPATARESGLFPCVDVPWISEPDLEALVAALRWVYEHPDEVRERGRTAAQYVHAHWTWDNAVIDMRERLRELVTPSAAEQSYPVHAWSDPETSDVNPEVRRASSSLGIPKQTLRNKVELSLCMIARDEEPRIEECLRSIQPYVDEIILVDTGSKDRTREVARDCGARVFEMQWPESFAEARNRSLELASGEWIFWMDADDVLPPECGKRLRELIRRHPEKDAAFQVQVRIPPGPGEFSESVVDHVKLFPNRPDLRFEHRIHEQILPSIRRAGLNVLFSDLYVVHRNYDRSDAGQEKKRRRDFRLLELDLRDRPDHPFVLFNLGMTYLHATKEFEVAAHYLRRCLDRSHWQDSIVRKAYAMLVTAQTCQQEWQAALAANEEGRRHYPDDAELLFQAGQLYQRVGRFDDARNALERLVSSPDDAHYRSVDVGLRTFRGRHELALLFRRMGDPRHAEQVLREIATAHPSYLPARVDLAETLLGLGESESARRILDELPSDPALEPDLSRLREQLTMASAGYR